MLSSDQEIFKNIFWALIILPYMYNIKVIYFKNILICSKIRKKECFLRKSWNHNSEAFSAATNCLFSIETRYEKMKCDSCHTQNKRYLCFYNLWIFRSVCEILKVEKYGTESMWHKWDCIPLCPKVLVTWPKIKATQKIRMKILSGTRLPS